MCDHVFDHLDTILTGISEVLTFINVHKSRANRFSSLGNLARVSFELVRRSGNRPV